MPASDRKISDNAHNSGCSFKIQWNGWMHSEGGIQQHQLMEFKLRQNQTACFNEGFIPLVSSLSLFFCFRCGYSPALAFIPHNIELLLFWTKSFCRTRPPHRLSQVLMFSVKCRCIWALACSLHRFWGWILRNWQIDYDHIKQDETLKPSLKQNPYSCWTLCGLYRLDVNTGNNPNKHLMEYNTHDGGIGLYYRFFVLTQRGMIQIKLVFSSNLIKKARFWWEWP